MIESQNTATKTRDQLEKEKNANLLVAMSGYHKLQVIREETNSSQYQHTSQGTNTAGPLYTENLSPTSRKSIRVYVDKDVEFTLEVANDQLTCGWLLSEVTRRYTEELNRIKKEREMQY